MDKGLIDVNNDIDRCKISAAKFSRNSSLNPDHNLPTTKGMTGLIP